MEHLVADQVDTFFSVTSPTNFRITTSPQMPVINGDAESYPESAISDLDWSASLQYSAPSVSCSGGPDFSPPTQPSGTGATFNPEFGGFYGGQLVVSAWFEQWDSAAFSGQVGGINPTKSAVKSYLGSSSAPFAPDDLKRIACWESGMTQFLSDGTPKVGGTKDAGIMQICYLRTPKHFFDWKENVAYGKTLLNDAKNWAWTVPAKVRSQVVRGQGPFPDATNFTNEQWRLEAIHAYNAGNNINENGYWRWNDDDKEWVAAPQGGANGYVDNVLSTNPECP